MTTLAPKRVFVVPYRDRIHHKFFFSKQMEFLLEGEDDYEILFVHQCDYFGPPAKLAVRQMFGHTIVLLLRRRVGKILEK